MAETFVNAGVVLGAAATDIYTVPASTTAIIIGCQVSNVGATNNELDFWWTDSSNSDAAIYLADGVDVPISASYEPIGGRLVLEAGDKLRGLSETASELEVTVSILELT